MPGNIRSLIIILILSFLGFFLLKPLAKKMGFINELNQWKKLWIGVTIIAFVSNNYWLFILISACYVIFRSSKSVGKITEYILLVCCFPPLANKIPGFGGINYIFFITWPILIAALLLLSFFITKPGLTVNRSFFRMTPDFYILAYFFITAILSFRDKSFTEGMRPSIYSFFYIVLPYYVISRYVNNIDFFKKVFFALIVPVFIMSIIACFETIKSWHVYDSLRTSLGLSAGSISSYKFRSGLLRASTAFGAIHLGYMASVAMCMGFFLVYHIKLTKNTMVIFLFMIIALLSTLSRGPWVGFFLMCVTFVLLNRDGLTKVIKYGFIGICFFPLIALTKAGQTFIDLLPFVGSGQADTVSYRQDLFTQSLIVIQRYPLFGSTKYLEEPEMLKLIQGEGIIDIVNTYIQIALEYGLIALSFFFATFLSVIIKIYRLRLALKKTQSEELFLLGNCLMAILIGTMFTIATVSTLGHGITQITYWLQISLCAAYINLANKQLKQDSVKIGRGSVGV